jgi:glutamate-1-semialdehyde 2,1-aminomutase
MAPSVTLPEEVNPQSKLSHDAISVLAVAKERFVQKHPKSMELHQKAVKSLPGGNTRSLLHTAPFPLFMKSGKGHQLTDEDGHMCVDSSEFD